MCNTWRKYLQFNGNFTDKVTYNKSQVVVGAKVLTAMIGTRFVTVIESWPFGNESEEHVDGSIPAFTAASQLPVSSKDRIILVA